MLSPAEITLIGCVVLHELSLVPESILTGLCTKRRFGAERHSGELFLVLVTCL